MNKNTKLALKYKSRILPFRKLSLEARYAIIYYMAIDGEAWEVSDELYDAICKGRKIPYKVNQVDKLSKLYKEAIRKSIGFYTEKYGACKFGYVHIPTRVLTKEVYNREEGIKEDFDSFEKYRKSLFKGIDMPNHSRTKRWPSILSSWDGCVLEDGWHRFHSYVHMKCRTIPCVFYVKDEDYKCE